MPEYRPLAVTPPPTQDQLLEVFRRSVPEDFFAGLEDHESYALFRAIASQWAVLGVKLTSAIEARYLKDSALAVDYPATEAQFARANVTVERTGSYEYEVVLNPGELVLELVGRRYINEEALVWHPGDRGERISSFRCVVATAAGNMDHIAEPDGTIGLDLIEIVDSARERAGIQGYVIDASNTLTDNGIDDLFAPEDVGLYVRITESSSAVNVMAGVRKILGFTWPEQEFPVGTGRYPRYVALDTSPRENLLAASVDDAGAFTDVTNLLSQEGSTGDVTIDLGTVNNAIYFGATLPMSGVVFDVATPGDGDWTVVWEYWDSLIWAPLLDVSDSSDGFRPNQAGEYQVNWATPTDVPLLADPGGTGVNGYFVRARVTAVAVSTTSPILSRAVGRPWRPLNDADATGWVLLGPADLGISLVECGAFTGGRDDDLYMLGADRGLYRQANEDPERFRERVANLLDTVSPNAINRAIDRALAPYGLDGYMIDVGNGLDGFFLDTDAVDYYEAGDTFPANKWKLLLSEFETRLFFLCVLPYLVEGEFGIALDEGPSFLDSAHNEWLGPAADAGFMDGFPVQGFAQYAGLWSTISKAKAGGVAFAFVRDLALNTLAC